jgi:hypothetical protein
MRGWIMQRIDEKVLVSTNRSGEPIGFLWRNSNYQVRTKPVRWFARRDWWLEATRVQRGVGATVLEVEVWRMVASKGEEPEAAKKTQFEIVHSSDDANDTKGIWRLMRVYD